MRRRLSPAGRRASRSMCGRAAVTAYRCPTRVWWTCGLLQKKDRLAADEIGEPAVGRHLAGIAVGLDDEAALRIDGEIAAQQQKILDRAGPDRVAVVPGVLRRIGHRDAAAEQQAEARAPIAEIVE